jgi:hypothetical protein
MGLNLHPNITGTVGLWQLQNSLADTSGNGLDLSVAAGSATYSTLSGSIVGFDFNKTRTLTAPINAALQLGGEITVQCLIKLRDNNVATWLMCYPGTSVNSELYHWYQNGVLSYADINNNTSGGSHLGPPYYDVTNLYPSVFEIAVRKTSLGSNNYLVETFVNGIKVASGFSGFTVQGITPSGTEQLWIGGYHGGSELDGVIASLRILNYARSDANLQADNAYTTGHIGQVIFNSSAALINTGLNGTANIAFSSNANLDSTNPLNGSANISFASMATLVSSSTAGASPITFSSSGTISARANINATSNINIQSTGTFVPLLGGLAPIQFGSNGTLNSINQTNIVLSDIKIISSRSNKHGPLIGVYSEYVQ